MRVSDYEIGAYNLAVL